MRLSLIAATAKIVYLRSRGPKYANILNPLLDFPKRPLSHYAALLIALAKVV